MKSSLTIDIYWYTLKLSMGIAYLHHTNSNEYIAAGSGRFSFCRRFIVAKWFTMQWKEANKVRENLNLC